MRRIIWVCSLVCSSLMFASMAQSQETGQQDLRASAVLIDAADAPGYKVIQEIEKAMDGGVEGSEATKATLATLSASENETLTTSQKDMLSSYTEASYAFFNALIGGSEIFEATFASIEELPANAGDVVTIAVTFFPEQASEILAAAVLTGEITQEDAIALALLAGANPEDVSTETAAGGDITAVPAPLGAGVGAGGAGGGDTTASTN
ncbi:hypothetical protein I533_07765 [Alteromonas mediterranea MED64]|uniref:hypothetical protein n=1 Tax=Alteromonas mediterranea TaxID=314275 RepID=UPI00035553EE|nr:hypothetical protein [Alteromonas mediterranea]AGP81529.1 hypothetical protein I533_07765 [Alteromonas mediterranea MED64]MBR9783484.1 hypothetical protein [Gammaproteobacteria bacterium]